MMDVRRLEEAELVPAEVECFGVAEAAHPLGQAEAGSVKLNREQRANELGLRRGPHEAVHPAVVVAFPVEQDDSAELRRIEHLAMASRTGS